MKKLLEKNPNKIKPPAQATNTPLKIIKLIAVDLNWIYRIRNIKTNVKGMSTLRCFSALSWFSKLPLKLSCIPSGIFMAPLATCRLISALMLEMASRYSIPLIISKDT